MTCQQFYRFFYFIMALQRLQGDFQLQHSEWPLAKRHHCIQVSDTVSGGASGTTVKFAEEDAENQCMILVLKGQCEWAEW